MYLRDRIGEKIQVSLGKDRAEIRTITDIISNTSGGLVVMWQSQRAQGACIPGLWEDWKQGKTPYN